MNKLLKIAVLGLAVAGLTACVQDLDTLPINQTTKTEFNQDAIFTKCYACLGLTGQTGNANSDVDRTGVDAGTSGFYRTIWYCNELSTDEAWWIWDDEESKQLVQTNWTGTNAGILAIYIRLMLDVKYCNHYLAKATTETEEDKCRYAEVRFIRALHYYYLMDMFLYAPFVEGDSNDYPHFLPRHKIYEWLVGELEELIIDLPAVRKSKYRVGKAAAQLLLARTYLNADVYNKYNPEWASGQCWTKAYDAATRVIEDNKGVHGLVTRDQKIETDSGYVYTAYQQLFMGDNHRDEIIKESLLQIYQDGVFAQSYAGSMMLVSAQRSNGLIAWGTEKGWEAMRTSPTMIDKFITPAGYTRIAAASLEFDEYKMPKQLHDDRAILCSDGVDTKHTFEIRGEQRTQKAEYLFDCWLALKFTGVYSTDQMPKLHLRRSTEFPDTDIPLMRLAEAYMIQAEALFRKGDAGAALKIINDVIRYRANADPLESLDAETLLDEWSREFHFEGRRRIDLIRFGRFFGEESDKHEYHWEGRMAADDGKSNFVAGTPEYMNWFPIPSDDKRSNPNYKLDVEGDQNNPFAALGGDGYSY